MFEIISINPAGNVCSDDFQVRFEIGPLGVKN